MKNVEIKLAFPKATAINYNLLTVDPDGVDNIDGTQYLIFKDPVVAGAIASKVVVVSYNYSAIELQARPLLIGLIAAIIITAFIETGGYST